MTAGEGERPTAEGEDENANDAKRDGHLAGGGNVSTDLRHPRFDWTGQRPRKSRPDPTDDVTLLELGETERASCVHLDQPPRPDRRRLDLGRRDRSEIQTTRTTPPDEGAGSTRCDSEL